jgi:ribosome-binding protein aMBF1 (putative translation factor)
MPKKNEPLMSFVANTTSLSDIANPKKTTASRNSKIKRTKDGVFLRELVPSNDSNDSRKIPFSALLDPAASEKEDTIAKALKRIADLEQQVLDNKKKNSFQQQIADSISKNATSVTNVRIPAQTVAAIDAQIEMRHESTRMSLRRLREERLAEMSPAAREVYLQAQEASRKAREEALAANPEAAAELEELQRKRMEESRNTERSRALSRVTTNWFKEQLIQLNMSQRQLAREMKVDPAAVSYMISGKRRVSIDEAKRISDIFGVPTTEVMRQVGVKIDDDGVYVPIGAYTTDGCAVLPLDHGGMPTKVLAPPDVGKRSFVIQDRSAGSPRDGWLMFTASEAMPPDLALNRLALITLQGADTRNAGKEYPATEILGIAMPGYNTAQYKILLAPELKEYLHDQFISHIRPILWIQPRGILHHFQP